MTKATFLLSICVCWAIPAFVQASDDLGPAQEENITLKASAVTVNAPTKESEIPVQLETKKAEGTAEGSPFVKMIMALTVITGVAFAIWLGLKKYRVSNRGQNVAMQMKVISQHHLGPKKSLAIVRVAGESILIGITDHHVSLIKSLSLLDEDVPAETPKSFKKVMSEEEEDFSITGIKDFVSGKLKNMRSFE